MLDITKLFFATVQDQLKLLENEEDNKLEFKERFNDSVLKIVSAFANTHRGLIIIGGSYISSLY